MPTYTNNEEAFMLQMDRILQDDHNTIVARGMTTKEICSETISILKPLQRCYFIPGRNDNVFAKVAETLWMLAGRDDIDWLSYYLPRAKDYSDNGRTWRGAYGPRLRNFNGSNHKVDQLAYVANSLNLDPFSRQAIIVIWDPSEDTIPVTKDRPCNNWLQFYIRPLDMYDGFMHLNLNITQRSCDLLWGYSGIDTFSWSVLLQMMSFWTGYPVGITNHFITSLHIYEQHWNKAYSLLHKWVPSNAYQLLEIPVFSTELEYLDAKLQHVFELEGEARLAPYEDILDKILEIEDQFLQECCCMLLAYACYKTINTESVAWYDVAYVLNHMMPNSDLRMAAIEYLTRDNNGLFDSLTLSTNESVVLRQVFQRI